MDTKTIVANFDEEDENENAIPDVVRKNVDKAVEANRAVAMRQMEVLSMQVDETQALLQSGNLTDEQFEKVMQESEKIRHAMSDTTTKLHKSNFELVVGSCAVLLFGGLFFTLRAA